ncbi:hypothetical protein AC1031_007957 [Aphanomyces cochlioides]|nr:hypothetical protein AC1031_007957 [Aphanomyces cochlioides]
MSTSAHQALLGQITYEASFIQRREVSCVSTTCLRRLQALFGVSRPIVARIWMLAHQESESTEVKHLLWALMFMKQYSSEADHASIAGVDEKTFRKWCWFWIEKMSCLESIDWDSRFDGSNNGATMFVSLDGTDFRINEPSEFDPTCYSHKFHGPGLRYEIGLCIQTGRIVWAHGGVPCGTWPDLSLARSADCHAVNDGELTLADRGYADPRYFYTPTYYPETGSQQKQVMVRHETVNARLKQFGVLKQVFRHHVEKHSLCFFAVVNVVELVIENSSPLFAI